MRLGSYAAGQLLGVKARQRRCLVRLSGVSKTYRDTLFRDVDLSIETGDRIGLVGPNGSGKTTLLRIITQRLEPDSGGIQMEQGLSWAEVSQIPQTPGPGHGGTLLKAVMQGMPRLDDLGSRIQEALAKMCDPELGEDEIGKIAQEFSELDEEYRQIGGYEVESRAKALLRGLGLGDELDRGIETLSGGEKTRAMIAHCLLLEPDLLLLDEPTNHLDVQCMEWLEEFLQTVRSAFIVISHDRSFLDGSVKRIIELENGEASIYPGNYTKYRELKELGEARDERDYELQQRSIKREEELIRFLKTLGVKKRRQAKSREKLLAKIARVPKPFQRREIRVLFKPQFPGPREVLRASSLSKAFGDRSLFTNLSFTLGRGERLGLVGPNGSGKTTLLRILGGSLEPDAGDVKTGPYVSTATYDQELSSLQPQNTVLEEVTQADPQGRQDAVRGLLAAFLFPGKEVDKKVSRLSGGEMGRLAIAKLVASGANLLILDEPTNHLDIQSREILEQALQTYQGTLAMASHDRRLIANVCSRLIVFSRDRGNPEQHDCTYQIYKDRQRRRQERHSHPSSQGLSGPRHPR